MFKKKNLNLLNLTIGNNAQIYIRKINLIKVVNFEVV